MSQPLYVQLAQLENQLIRNKLTREEYVYQKWDVLKKIKEQRETVMPVFRDKFQRELRDSIKILYCYVPPSPFVFGPNDGYGELWSGIYMGKNPVKVKDFLHFVQQSGWDYPQSDIDIMMQYSPEENCPACNLSWLDAKEYCRWLRKTTGEYYSLPQETEWEYTARGIDGRPYPWGYREPDVTLACFSGENAFTHTVPCGSYPENKTPFGCLDMIGNIWEWCVDEFDDPNDPHVLKGGAFCHGVEYLHCGARILCEPRDKRFEYAGFRVLYLPGEMLTNYQEKVAQAAAAAHPQSHPEEGDLQALAPAEGEV